MHGTGKVNIVKIYDKLESYKFSFTLNNFLNIVFILPFYRFYTLLLKSNISQPHIRSFSILLFSTFLNFK